MCRRALPYAIMLKAFSLDRLFVIICRHTVCASFRVVMETILFVVGIIQKEAVCQNGKSNADHID